MVVCMSAIIAVTKRGFGFPMIYFPSPVHCPTAIYRSFTFRRSLRREGRRRRGAGLVRLVGACWTILRTAPCGLIMVLGSLGTRKTPLAPAGTLLSFQYHREV